MLDNGQVLQISARHPTADNRTFGELREGTGSASCESRRSNSSHMNMHLRTIFFLLGYRVLLCSGAMIGSTLVGNAMRWFLTSKHPVPRQMVIRDARFPTVTTMSLESATRASHRASSRDGWLVSQRPWCVACGPPLACGSRLENLALRQQLPTCGARRAARASACPTAPSGSCSPGSGLAGGRPGGRQARHVVRWHAPVSVSFWRWKSRSRRLAENDVSPR